MRRPAGELAGLAGSFLLCCPILSTPMADLVILPSGWTYERACVLACAELDLSLGPDGVVAGDRGRDTPGGGVAAAIPNDALRAPVRTWCVRSGRASPMSPSGEEARVVVLRAVAAGTQPPVRSSSNLSCSSEGASVPTRSASNLSCSLQGAYVASMSSSSSGRSSREMAPIKVQVVVSGKEAAKAEQDEPVRVANAEEAVAKAVEGGDETEVEAARAALRRATREGAARRRALCGLRLLAALRRVLLSARSCSPRRPQERSASHGRRTRASAGEERRSRPRWQERSARRRRGAPVVAAGTATQRSAGTGCRGPRDAM